MANQSLAQDAAEIRASRVSQQSARSPQSEIDVQTGLRPSSNAELEREYENIDNMCAVISSRLREMGEAQYSADDVRTAVAAIKFASEAMSELPQQIQESQGKLMMLVDNQKANLQSVQNCIRLVPYIKKQHMQNLYSQKEIHISKQQKRRQTIKKHREKLLTLVRRKESLLADPQRVSKRQGLQVRLAEETYKSRIYRNLTLFDVPPKNPGALKDGIWGHIAWSLRQPVSMQDQIQTINTVTGQVNEELQDSAELQTQSLA